MTKPIIIDCDPGHDDAIALLLAFAHRKRLDIRGVTVVAGNQTLEKTVNNALRVLSFAEIECEVAAGYAKPLIRPLQTAPEVHGDSGIDGPILPEATLKVSARHAVDLITQEAKKCREKITLVPLGPLTNIAAALVGAPDIRDKIERIVLMGGAAYEGNWTPAAEFNILVDPEAASIVFNVGLPVTMVGLDVTHKAQLHKDDIEKIRSINKKVATMVAELLDFYSKFHKTMGFKGSPLHDPLAVAAVLEPGVIKTKNLAVEVETAGRFTTGRTVVDIFGVTGKAPNVDVAFEVDRERFVEMIYQAVGSYH